MLENSTNTMFCIHLHITVLILQAECIFLNKKKLLTVFK